MIRMHRHVVAGLALISGLALQGPPFRSGLTATVVSAAPVGGARCVNVSLRWPARGGAKSYQLRVAPTREGAWTALPSSSACGTSHALSATAAVDPQPQPAAAPARRLFYRIIAVGPSGPIDSTDVVPVEIAPVPAPRQP